MDDARATAPPTPTGPAAVIIGIGTDLLDIRRIERTLERFGPRFCERVFTATERARCDAHVARAARYAQRYAAKEACAKALGTGFRDGVAWRGIAVDNLPSGKPFLTLHDGALRRLEVLTPAGHDRGDRAVAQR